MNPVTAKMTADSNLSNDVSQKDDRERHPHRAGGVPLLHKDVSGTVVDVFEAVGTQQNPSVPPRHDHHDIAHIQDLW